MPRARTDPTNWCCSTLSLLPSMGKRERVEAQAVVEWNADSGWCRIGNVADLICTVETRGSMRALTGVFARLNRCPLVRIIEQVRGGGREEERKYLYCRIFSAPGGQIRSQVSFRLRRLEPKQRVPKLVFLRKVGGLEGNYWPQCMGVLFAKMRLFLSPTIDKKAHLHINDFSY